MIANGTKILAKVRAATPIVATALSAALAGYSFGIVDGRQSMASQSEAVLSVSRPQQKNVEKPPQPLQID
jgi:hypothetical protein